MTKLSRSGKRSFTVIGAYHTNGCPTKFHEDSRLISRDAGSAASKAFNRLCNMKRIKGACSMYIEVKETTQGSDHKVYSYLCSRKKLDKPIELKGRTIEYVPVHHAKEVPKKSCKQSAKSPGPMLSKSRRASSKKSTAKATHSKKTHSKKTKKSWLNYIM